MLDRREAIGAMIGAVAGAAMPVAPKKTVEFGGPSTAWGFPCAIPAGSTIEGIVVDFGRGEWIMVDVSYCFPSNHA